MVPSAAAACTGGAVSSLAAGVQLATELIDSGAAEQRLAEWLEFSRR